MASSQHQKPVLLHTNDFSEYSEGICFKEWWELKFCLPGKKKPFTGTLEVSSDKNPFNLKPVLSYRMNFKDGRRHGVSEEFYDNGKLEVREHYKDDDLHGVHERFYKNGNLKSRQHYRNGLPKK